MNFKFGSVMLTNCIIACISSSITIIWLEINKHKKPKDSIKVLIYKPLKKKNCFCRASFNIQCGNVNCSSVNTKHIIDCLNNAKNSIDICVFSLSNEILASTICNAYSRGVVVRLIVSNCLLIHCKEIKLINSLKIPMKYQKNSHKYMHHKFCIVDSTNLITGSMNWTHQATFDNWEHVLITTQSDIVSEFSNAFEKMWLTIEL
ncbi:Phospholipase D/Transphosphatidylase,Phospholipase D-like domain [Cinara cedri]|uniref:Mitochondrial cardiolipin hydrolase n=1 Tax=Cinara cedri TaxID=506608 RepID=A0A5E4MX98_9HEMI|nr:Phospholipase D/Transphosphatidylase,Phospholipase D-like domain [Cinara cedri]